MARERQTCCCQEESPSTSDPTSDMNTYLCVVSLSGRLLTASTYLHTVFCVKCWSIYAVDLEEEKLQYLLIIYSHLLLLLIL